MACHPSGHLDNHDRSYSFAIGHRCLWALVLRCIAEGVATRDGVCAYDSFSKRKLLKPKRQLCMREDQLAACGTRSS